jgi:hypothetical protein
MTRKTVGIMNGNYKAGHLYDEPESQPLAFERDANAIYQELVRQAGADVAKARAFFLVGSSYDELCAGLLQSLQVCSNNAPAKLDPRTARQIANDADDQETAETRSSDYPR